MMLYLEEDVELGARALHALNEARIWPNAAGMRLPWEELEPTTHAAYKAQSRAVLAATAEHIASRSKATALRRLALSIRSRAFATQPPEAAQVLHRLADSTQDCALAAEAEEK